MIQRVRLAVSVYFSAVSHASHVEYAHLNRLSSKNSSTSHSSRFNIQTINIIRVLKWRSNHKKMDFYLLLVLVYLDLAIKQINL